MSEQNVRRPAEVAARLGVSTSTLRRWSQRFSEYLSPDAGEPTNSLDADGSHRRYTDEVRPGAGGLDPGRYAAHGG